MLATSRLVDTKIRAKVAKSADTWMLVDLERFRCGSEMIGRGFVAERFLMVFWIDWVLDSQEQQAFCTYMLHCNSSISRFPVLYDEQQYPERDDA